MLAHPPFRTSSQLPFPSGLNLLFFRFSSPTPVYIRTIPRQVPKVLINWPRFTCATFFPSPSSMFAPCFLLVSLPVLLFFPQPASPCGPPPTPAHYAVCLPSHSAVPFAAASSLVFLFYFIHLQSHLCNHLFPQLRSFPCFGTGCR